MTKLIAQIFIYLVVILLLRGALNFVSFPQLIIVLVAIMITRNIYRDITDEIKKSEDEESNQ